MAPFGLLFAYLQVSSTRLPYLDYLAGDTYVILFHYLSRPYTITHFK